ncbi:hypothetical protein L198_03294 [Cryptococcus wingfieldii CBS 7118]|uniref:F-box domain-containing protein n=1 Tax=Cryptococcus wingfieldii CBS 7118 TaxID=1295528 RepID=A0A1E3JEZ3_9TREE|nr:hypothetical protein L198_03294 [Cryptococcus wingfieldii CBS 7118]ODN99450.1 hypothetical protein L198_03294 [Cryptococcus wingfieldii CBS 7118]
MDEQDLHHLDDQLRAIRVDDGPRLQPLRLDKMFLRAHQWRGSTSNAADISIQHKSPPTPPREPPIYPLPKSYESSSATLGDTSATRATDQVSPLAALFQYAELVPLVLESFDQPRDLAKICRVCKEWCSIGRKQMYSHVWVRPWEEAPHMKLVMLFETLHKRPELCRLVRRLEVRFFPLATRGEARSELDDRVQLAISHMDNLTSIAWTRDKSLNSALFASMIRLPHLSSFEISGHSYRYYDPALLSAAPALEDLRIMMPDPHLKGRLVDVLSKLSSRDNTDGKGAGLKSLGIVCQESSLIDDNLLRAMAPYLTSLRRLTFWGCTHVTRAGITTILEESSEKIEELSLDAPPQSQLLNLTNLPELPLLHTLSISITVPRRESPEHQDTLLSDLPSLPSCPSLRSLHLTSSPGRPFLTAQVWRTFQAQMIGGSLHKLSLIGIVLKDAAALGQILASNPDLDELYLTALHPSFFDPTFSSSVSASAKDLLASAQLRIVHVNFIHSSPVTTTRGSLAHFWRNIICTQGSDSMLGATVEQVGCGNVILEVHKRLNSDGCREVELCRWSKTVVPGYFNVWRA